MRTSDPTDASYVVHTTTTPSSLQQDITRSLRQAGHSPAYGSVDISVDQLDDALDTRDRFHTPTVIHSCPEAIVSSAIELDTQYQGHGHTGPCSVADGICSVPRCPVVWKVNARLLQDQAAVITTLEPALSIANSHVKSEGTTSVLQAQPSISAGGPDSEMWEGSLAQSKPGHLQSRFPLFMPSTTPADDDTFALAVGGDGHLLDSLRLQLQGSVYTPEEEAAIEHASMHCRVPVVFSVEVQGA